MQANGEIIPRDALILVTGAAGFIGGRVIERLIELGFQNLRCFVRPTGNVPKLEALQRRFAESARIEIFKGNLLSRDDCGRAVEGVSVVYHLAAGRGEKMVADAFMNSVITRECPFSRCKLFAAEVSPPPCSTGAGR